MSPTRLFVTGTGTGIGKTVFTVALTHAARSRGLRVRAVKPVETGCLGGRAEDALALAAAAGRPEDAEFPGFHRGERPLAPFAATLEGEPPPPPIPALARAIDAASDDADLVLVEGAGGLLVPYDETHTFADLAVALATPLVLLLPNELGALHHAEAAIEAAKARGLQIAALVLVARPAADLAAESNARVLERRHPAVRLAAFPWSEDAAHRASAASRLLDIILDT